MRHLAFAAAGASLFLFFVPAGARAQSQASTNSAVSRFQQTLVANPDDVTALRGLVDALVAQGQWRQAVQPLQHLDNLQPNDAARIFQLGQMESWQGKPNLNV